MLKDEFEKGYAERSGITVEDLHKHGQEAVPCDCGEESCRGWAMRTTGRDQKDNICEQCGAEIELLKIEISELKTYVLKIEEELRALYVSIRETKPVADVWKEEE